MLATQNPLDEALCRRLEARGLSLLVAQPGPRFSGINWTSTGRGTLSLAAGEEADFRQLAAALADVRLAGVIHLWARRSPHRSRTRSHGRGAAAGHSAWRGVC